MKHFLQILKTKTRSIKNEEAPKVGNPLVMGVRLSYLAKLPIDPSSSFQKVCEYIKQMTLGMKTGYRSLALKLHQQKETRDIVSLQADVFVSYAWSGGFGATIKALLAHFGDTDPFVWMDVAIVDQHAAEITDVDFFHWAKTFHESLKNIGRAVLVLTPGEKPIAITRSWCCFEWTVIQQVGIPYEYCVDPEDEERLIKQMETGVSPNDYNDLFSGINVETAKAFKEPDQVAILTLMREIGLLQVNDMIMNALKEWLLHVNKQGLMRHGDEETKEVAMLLNARGALHEANVRFCGYFRKILMIILGRT
jgi:hypothetical protein